MSVSELINEIVSEWAYRVEDGMPNPKNPNHVKELNKVLSEMGMASISRQFIRNLIEAESGQFTTPALNKVIKYKNAKGEDTEGVVGNLLRLPKEHPGRKAAEASLPPEGSPERDAINKDLGGEGQPTKPEDEKGKEGGEQGAGGEEEKMKQAQAMFDPKNDPAMAARLDKEKETLAKLAGKDTEQAPEEKPEKKDDEFNPIPSVDVQNEIPEADPETFGGVSDIPDGIDKEDLEKFNTNISKVKEMVDDAKAKGEKAPNINLCQITVPGTNLYCDDNLGIPREEMPQFKGKPQPGTPAADMPVDENGEVDTEPLFKKMLKDKNITVTQTEVPADKLKATQNELVGAKVVGMISALEKDPTNEGITAPIYVSRDGFVIDGHHRWAAIAAYNASNPDSQIPMKVQVIDMDIKDVIPMANKFAEEQGVAAKKADANKEDVPVKSAELEPASDDPNSNVEKFKGEQSGKDIQTVEIEGGGRVFGTQHGNTKMVDDIINQVKSTIPKEKWKDIVFVGEGGATNDAGELEFNDEMDYAVPKFKELGASIDTWDGDDMDVHNDQSKLYQKQKEKTGLNDSQIKAGNWASMIGQGESTNTMSPNDYLDDEGKQFLQDAAKEAGFPPIQNWDKPTQQDKDTLYRLSFPEDNGDKETKINDIQVAFNEIRDENLIQKSKELSAKGKIPITIAGESHVDLVDKMSKKGEEKPEEKPTQKLPEPKEPSKKDGGVVYSIGGGYYSDTPGGPAQYMAVESVVEKALIEGDINFMSILFEAVVKKTTARGKQVTLQTIEPSQQKAATKAAKQSASQTSDNRLDAQTVNNSQKTFNTNSKFSEPGMTHDERVEKLEAMKAKNINSVEINDIYKAMGIKVGNTKFPSKYMSVLTNALNFAKGPFTITDLTDAAGAGTLDSTLGELITLMGSTIQDPKQRQAFFDFLREQIKNGGNTSALTMAWVNSAQDSCEAFHRKLAKDCPGGHEVKTNFWDIPSEAAGAGIVNYKRDKGKSTDINTLVDCISKDGSRTTKWQQPSLKKNKKVNAFNSTTGRVFATTVLRWGTPQEKAQYSALGNELDSYEGLDDKAPAGDFTITDKKGNTRPMTIKERKTQLNAEMRAIEKGYEDKIPEEANPKQAVIRQAKLHKDYLSDTQSIKERDKFLYKWLDMKPAERKKLAAQIAKQMGQKGDKYAKELEADLNKLSQYDTSTAQGLENALEELGFTAAKDKQKLMVAIMNGVINTAGDKTKSAEFKKKLTKNSHGHSKAVLEYLINDNENKKALLENISTAFPLKDLMEGKEWAILGEKGGGINLDRDTITKCLGADKFEDVVEKLVIVNYKGEPTLAYAADNGKRTIPIGEINCRPDGIMYGSTWKLELSIHEAFADCCKEHDK